jgi:hypothetical protein
VAFTSFSAVAPGQTVVLRGDTQATFGTRTAGSSPVRRMLGAFGGKR